MHVTQVTQVTHVTLRFEQGAFGEVLHLLQCDYNPSKRLFGLTAQPYYTVLAARGIADWHARTSSFLVHLVYKHWINF